MSQSRTILFSRPAFFCSTTSFHAPSFTLIICATCASPTSSLAVAITFTSSFAGEMRSFSGSTSVIAGSRSGSERSSYSGLNLLSKPVSALVRCRRYVPVALIGTRAVSRPSGSTTSGIVFFVLPTSSSSSPFFTGWFVVIFNSTSVPSSALSLPPGSVTVFTSWPE